MSEIDIKELAYCLNENIRRHYERLELFGKLFEQSGCFVWLSITPVLQCQILSNPPLYVEV